MLRNHKVAIVAKCKHNMQTQHAHTPHTCHTPNRHRGRHPCVTRQKHAPRVGNVVGLSWISGNSCCRKRCCTTVVGLSWVQPRLAWSWSWEQRRLAPPGPLNLVPGPPSPPARPAQLSCLARSTLPPGRSTLLPGSCQARSTLLPGPSIFLL